MRLFQHSDECKVCEAHLARIEDLKAQIARLERDRENERAEYKRAIDVILVKQNLPAVGQGSNEFRGIPQMDPAKYFAFLEEEVKPSSETSG